MRRVHKLRQKPGQKMVNGNLMNKGGKRKKSVRERNNSCMQRERKSGKTSEKSINFHMIIKKISVLIRNIVLVTRSVIFNEYLHCMHHLIIRIMHQFCNTHISLVPKGPGANLKLHLYNYNII